MAVERIIEAGKVYGKAEFLARAGWTQHSYRAAKRRGLKVVPDGKQVFIRGSDFIAYLDQRAQELEAVHA